MRGEVLLTSQRAGREDWRAAGTCRGRPETRCSVALPSPGGSQARVPPAPPPAAVCQRGRCPAGRGGPLAGPAAWGGAALLRSKGGRVGPRPRSSGNSGGARLCLSELRGASKAAAGARRGAPRSRSFPGRGAVRRSAAGRRPRARTGHVTGRREGGGVSRLRGCARCDAVTSARCARTLSPAGGHTVRVRRAAGRGSAPRRTHGNDRGAGLRRGGGGAAFRRRSRRAPAPCAFPRASCSASLTAKINTRSSHEAPGAGSGPPAALGRLREAPPRGRLGRAEPGRAGPSPGEERCGFLTCTRAAALCCRQPPQAVALTLRRARKARAVPRCGRQPHPQASGRGPSGGREGGPGIRSDKCAARPVTVSPPAPGGALASSRIGRSPLGWDRPSGCPCGRHRCRGVERQRRAFSARCHWTRPGLPSAARRLRSRTPQLTSAACRISRGQRDGVISSLS